MLVLLLLSAAYQATYPWLQWVRAFAEASAVGAMADWYAVVALFRHPLGLPIPHTAIIPNKKDSIGESLGEFVEQNFLTPKNIIGKLEEHNAAKAVAEWLVNQSNSHAVAQAVGEFIPGILSAMDDEDLVRFFDHTVTPQLLRLDVSRMAGNVLALLTEGNRHQALLDRALHAFEGWLAANQGLIRAKFSEGSRYTPGLLDSYIVEKFLAGMVALVHEVVENPSHELRLQFDQATQELIHELKNSTEYQQRGRAVMRDFIEHVRKESYYRSLWDDIRMRIGADLDAEHSLLREHIASALVFLGKGLLEDPAVQHKLNAWWLNAVHQIVLRYRHQISGLITEVVKSWDAEEVSRKVELEIGKDLQYIRINGTLVGGTVGLLLHAVILVTG
jgi:uncharacterized membrane-anchored protein YjiN (DUF445 family)